MIGKERGKRKEKGGKKNGWWTGRGGKMRKRRKKEKKRKRLDPRIRVAHILSARQSSILHTHTRQKEVIPTHHQVLPHPT